MNNIKGKKNNELSELHNVHVEILDEVVRICEKHKLTYFLVAGTLLGAVRHKGFIPWDDDLDIGMPRQDYDKFIKIAASELNKKYFMHNIFSDKGYWLNFTKIRKNNTLFDETMIENIEAHKGIFIDIFPLDNLNNNKFLFKIKWSILANLRMFSLYYRGVYDKNAINHKFTCKIFSVFGSHKLLKFCDWFMSLNKNTKSKYLVSYGGIYSRHKENFERQWFFPTNKIEFEGKMYSCPNNPDALLTHIYGDYMKLPPKEKRVTHLPKQILFDLKKGK